MIRVGAVIRERRLESRVLPSGQRKRAAASLLRTTPMFQSTGGTSSGAATWAA